MNVDLGGKKAVVSGSTAGIGLAIASGLARAGAHVFVNGRSEKNVQMALARLAKDVPGAKAEGVAADLSTAEGVAAFVARVPDADIL
jgi:NAD(P)-dependent dehydrogenase (short-subunit alcohol dehydrogenase family)